MTDDAVTDDAVTDDAVTDDAVTDDAVTDDAVAGQEELGLRSATGGGLRRTRGTWTSSTGSVAPPVPTSGSGWA